MIGAGRTASAGSESISNTANSVTSTLKGDFDVKSYQDLSREGQILYGQDIRRMEEEEEKERKRKAAKSKQNKKAKKKQNNATKIRGVGSNNKYQHVK